jgi:hypothetical protein
MRLSKLDLLAIVVFVGGAILVEHANRTRIEAPPPVAVAAQRGRACPINESVPFSAECMAFIQDALAPLDLRRRLNGADTSAESPELP